MDQKNEKIVYVTIELSRKQVDMEHIHINEKNKKKYLRIFAPGGGILFYPAESIKVKKEDEKRVYFTRPEGTELQVSYSERIPNVPDSAPDSEKYNQFTKTVKIEDLKAMYEEERRVFLENTGFYNMTVPTSWGRKFSSNGREYVSVSIPIRENGSGDVYYSFILPAEKFMESKKEEGMSYFGFPKKKKDEPEKDFMIELRTSVKSQVSDEYEDWSIDVSSMQLKQHVDAALNRKLIKDMFVSTEVSEKLVRYFEAKENKKQLAAIMVPIYETANDEKATFYEIVVPKERVRASEKDGFVVLSLFKNNPDGNEYTVSGKKSVLNPITQEYDKVSLEMTSQDVVRYFEISAQIYRETRGAGEHSLADELSDEESHTETTSEDENAVHGGEENRAGFAVRRHGGR